MYGGTPSVTSREPDCTLPIDAAFSVGGFVGLTARLQMCQGYGITREHVEGNFAWWSTDLAAGLRKVQTDFIQKVPEGVVPIFNIEF
jgi:hypothetical protein